MGMRVLVESKLYPKVGHAKTIKFSAKDPKPGELTMTRWKQDFFDQAGYVHWIKESADKGKTRRQP